MTTSADGCTTTVTTTTTTTTHYKQITVEILTYKKITHYPTYDTVVTTTTETDYVEEWDEVAVHWISDINTYC
jgi:hypothetical protein